MRIRALVFVFFLLPAQTLFAQRTPAVPHGEIQTGVNYWTLNNDFPNWKGVWIRGILRTGMKDTWNAEVLRQAEFDDTGTFFSVGNTHTINDDWYSYLAVGSSTGGFFFPSVRVDGQISKKWLNKRKLVTSLGGGYFDSKDIHHDSSVAVGGIYYFDKPWTIQGAVRWNVSSPGNVVSRSQFIAVTEGREGEHYFVVRGQTGREAYQAITENIFLVDFPSHDVSVLWKQWLGNDWGFIALGEYYKSDFYQRTGGSIGIFKSF